MRPTASTAALCLLLYPVAAPAQEAFRWSERIAPGRQVEVVGIAADIDAGPASGDRAELTASGLEAGARVEVEEHGGGVTFCIVPAGMQRRAGGGRCTLEGGHGRRRFQEDVRVQLRVPAGVRLAASTVSGRVRATGMAADVEARSVSGDVSVSSAGVVEAGSVSGDVSVRMGRLPRGGTLEVRSVSGDLEVTIPAGAGAEVRARTLSGRIESDFPLELNGGERRGGGFAVGVGSRARGTLGGGGVRLELETVSGDIALRRSR